jgi:hypothetical protein
MSHPAAQSAAIAVLAPVWSVAGAAEAAGAGAELVDAGADADLVAAIRRAALDVLICGPGEDADLGRDIETALRTGGGLLCRGQAEAGRASRQGVPAERIIVQVAPGEVAAAVEAGWRALVDVDEGADADEGEDAGAEAARAEAIAAVCTWLGVSVVRTRRVTQIRRCLDMTESILGTRPPAWAIRGLG